MGNFGKRILIVLISVLAIVCLILVGNAIQQSEKIHKVNNSKEVKEETRDFAREVFKYDLNILEKIPGSMYNFHPGSHHIGNSFEI